MPIFFGKKETPHRLVGFLEKSVYGRQTGSWAILSLTTMQILPKKIEGQAKQARTAESDILWKKADRPRE